LPKEPIEQTSQSLELLPIFELPKKGKGIEMKRIGIVGGLGPESTGEYYKEIISAFNTKYSGLAYPEIILYSANITSYGFIAQ
jgi:2-iminoacetate synthase ThiH